MSVWDMRTGIPKREREAQGREGPERWSLRCPEWAPGLIIGLSRGRPEVARRTGLQGSHQSLTIRNNCFLLAIYTNVFIFVFLYCLGELSLPLLTQTCRLHSREPVSSFCNVPKHLRQRGRRRAAAGRRPVAGTEVAAGHGHGPTALPGIFSLQLFSFVLLLKPSGHNIFSAFFLTHS